MIVVHFLHHRLIQNNSVMLQNDELVAKVALTLLRGESFEQAGELYEKVNQIEKAFDCYRKAQAFPRAIELARIFSPSGMQPFTSPGQWLMHFQEP